MPRTRSLFTGAVVAVSVIYKFTEHMAYMKPIVTWLNGKIGGDTLIEILLGALVIYLLVSQGEREAPLTEPSQAQPPSQSPVQTVSPTISPKIDASQHHHYYSEPAPKAIQAPPALSPRRTPNIVGKKARIAWLTDTGNGLYEPENNGAVKAVVAEFRNEPGEHSIITWHHVRASIAYYDEHGAELADVGRASWLEANSPITDMPSNITRTVIVAIRADKWLVFDGADTRPLSQDIRRAKIVLQDDRQFSTAFDVVVDLNLGAVGTTISVWPK